MYRTPKPRQFPRETIDDTFSCTSDVVDELRRLDRPKMASFVAHIGRLASSADERVAELWQRLAECQRQLPQQQKEKPFDPTPRPEESD